MGDIWVRVAGTPLDRPFDGVVTAATVVALARPADPPGTWTLVLAGRRLPPSARLDGLLTGELLFTLEAGSPPPPPVPPADGPTAAGYRLREWLPGQAGEQAWRADGATVRIIPLAGRAASVTPAALAVLARTPHPCLAPWHGVWVRTPAETVRVDAQTTLPADPAAELVVVTDADPGTCLAEAVAPDPGTLLDWLDGVADALDELTARRETRPAVCNLGVRPNNLFVADGQLLLTADVTACLVGSPPGLAAGHPNYAAPELIDNRPGDRTDQYALAITAYELLASRLPFDPAEPLAAHLAGRLDFAGVSAAEAAVLRRATAVRPADRFGSCGEFARALRAAHDYAAGRPPDPPTARPASLPAAVSNAAVAPARPGWLSDSFTTPLVPMSAKPFTVDGSTLRASRPVRRRSDFRSLDGDEPAPTVSRRATVRLYSRMAPDRSYPLLVVLSAAEVAAVRKAGVAQTEGEGFTVDVDATLEVEPVLPGCDVYPPREHLAAGDDGATARFWVVPHVLGRVNGAKVVVRRGGRVLSEVPLDVRVRRQTLAVVFGAAGMASPYVMSGLKKLDLDPAAQPRGGFPLFQQAAAWAVDALRPELVGFALLAAAGACWWLLRPKARDVFWDVAPATRGEPT